VTAADADEVAKITGRIIKDYAAAGVKCPVC
jgi:hypothetical protein